MAHHYKWETFGGDELGLCDEPGCRPGMVGNVRFNGHTVVVSRPCRYCWASFSPQKPSSLHCSKVCRARDAAHESWVRETRADAVYGRPGRKLPTAGASLLESVARFELELVAS